ncbi:AMSH-like ubiquitin thioesterase 3 [Platanthera guangdongensis]|uniref:AMSH-like ubiquitin thioesterase 3 n=1 Tax=Platanthera guangdongensis TaxID=2320717 RepID=A0ABR2MUJ3_9ASPA
MATESWRGMLSPGTARSAARAININASAQKVEVDNRISLHYYYRIAGNLLRQASIYREEKNLIDLYIILLRFSSLMCETIPSHRDYQALLSKERVAFRKKLLDVINELEALKPLAQHQVDEINKGNIHRTVGVEQNSYDPAFARNQLSNSFTMQQVLARSTSELLQKQTMERNQALEKQMDRRFKKLNINLPNPKEETLSKHSILGPNGLQGSWAGSISGIRVQYPRNVDLLTQDEIPGLNQEHSHDPAILTDTCSQLRNSEMEPVLSLDDGSWSVSGEGSCSVDTNTAEEEIFQLNIRQPSIPPVLTQIQPQPRSISPSRVADPRPGLQKLSHDGDSKPYQKLHISVQMLEIFLKLAEANTKKNLETCGVLAGLLKNSTFVVTTLIIPKQEATSDSCQTTHEEEIFNVQDQRSLFPLGWIHTHPTQTCFMSSIDLHTHYSYQIMLPEAIAIVMAPTDKERTHGIFHLSEPGGVSVIRSCQERGFHPHEEPDDGSPIYEHCSHVLMNANISIDVVDLRNNR